MVYGLFVHIVNFECAFLTFLPSCSLFSSFKVNLYSLFCFCVFVNLTIKYIPYLPINSAPLPHFGQAAADFVRTSGQKGADAAHTILCLFRQYCAGDITKIPNFT